MSEQDKRDEQEIVLPEFPDAAFVLERTKTMAQDYAREAVRLDRERRSKPWPQEGDECWITWCGGGVCRITYDAKLNADLLARNRIFRTEAEARAKDERDLVMAEWERAADWESGDKWYSTRDNDDMAWKAHVYRYSTPHMPAFASRESCEAFIKRMSKPDGSSRLDCLTRGKP